MLAQISNAGSSSPSVSSVQASGSATSSFSDLLDALVQAPTEAEASPTSPVSTSTSPDSAASVAAPDTPNMAQDAPVSEPAPELSSLPQAQDAVAISEQVTPDVISAQSKAGALSGTESREDPKPGVEDHKDDKKDDPSEAVALLSLIPATVVPAAVVPVNSELQGHDVQGGSSEKEVAPVQIAAASTKEIAAAANSVVIAEATSQPNPADPASAIAPSTQETASNGPAATGSNTGQIIVPGQQAQNLSAPAEEATPLSADLEPVKSSTIPQTAANGEILKSIVRKAEVPTAQSPAQPELAVATRIGSEDNAPKPEMPLMPQGNSAADQIQTPVPVAQVVAAEGEKVQASQGDRIRVDRAVSKERASVRQIQDDIEPEADTIAVSSFADSTPVPPQPVLKTSESVMRQDVPSQPMAADAHAAEGTLRRPEHASSTGAFSEAVSSSSNSAMQAARQSSWMNSVRLMERVNQSEMRVGIQSDFGDIAVRTALNHHELSAEISVQHAGLRDLIAAEIPSLQARLSEQHIPISDVSVTANLGGGSNAGSSGFQQWSHNGQQTAQSSVLAGGEGSNERDAGNPVEVLERGTGLDIRI